MSKLMDYLRENPTAVFEINIDLPSGVRLSGTAGPMINGVAVVDVSFSPGPPSDADLARAREVMNYLMGVPAAFMEVSSTPEEHKAALVKMRRMMGGGQG